MIILRKQVKKILEEYPESRECNLTLYNALCDEYYNNCEKEEDAPLFEVISTVEYLRLLKDDKLPTLESVIKHRNLIRRKYNI